MLSFCVLYVDCMILEDYVSQFLGGFLLLAKNILGIPEI
ncbi:hypothetical protein DSOL_2249 [Desulfosporosinus metallidurans]|uniref:Uncharacterized protein n=1 Tax=Desulfosporosinus metallidurans TaxID=1888891 RepID=A0A1Q8QWP5_9FIRM|nr:hypothetical protein DSOL_2249 [Desulfosporosinus metallidurans]